MDIDTWIRQNKKQFAREFIRNIPSKPSAQPAAIFTAGLPGAGKTEFTIEILKSLFDPTLRIDMDEIASMIEGYSPKKADLFRRGASALIDRIYDEATKNKLDFIMDGTFSRPKSLQNLDRALEKGYKVKVYYIHQDPIIAWQFTKDRELLEHRAINRESFIETYQLLENNLKFLQNYTDKISLSIVMKDSQNKIGKIYENVKTIDEVIESFLSKEDLESAILKT